MVPPLTASWYAEGSAALDHDRRPQAVASPDRSENDLRVGADGIGVAPARVLEDMR